MRDSLSFSRSAVVPTQSMGTRSPDTSCWNFLAQNLRLSWSESADASGASRRRAMTAASAPRAKNSANGQMPQHRLLRQLVRVYAQGTIRDAEIQRENFKANGRLTSGGAEGAGASPAAPLTIDCRYDVLPQPWSPITSSLTSERSAPSSRLAGARRSDRHVTARLHVASDNALEKDILLAHRKDSIYFGTAGSLWQVITASSYSSAKARLPRRRPSSSLAVPVGNGRQYSATAKAEKNRKGAYERKTHLGKIFAIDYPPWRVMAGRPARALRSSRSSFAVPSLRRPRF